MPEQNASFLKATAALPSYPNLYVNLGILNTAMGLPELAESYFQRAIILSPRWPGRILLVR